LVTVTVTPGTTAPDASRTVPTSAPRVICADAAAGMVMVSRATSATRTTSNKRVMQFLLKTSDKPRDERGHTPGVCRAAVRLTVHAPRPPIRQTGCSTHRLVTQLVGYERRDGARARTHDISDNQSIVMNSLG
jgi:hypothetical protein